MSIPQEMLADYDRCGWGLPWGCKEHLMPGDDVSLVLNAADPVDVIDNGHRLFHTACLPAHSKPAFADRRIGRGASYKEAYRARRVRA